jgi:hypothetical protein
LVQRAGVPAGRWRVLLGAACTAFTFHCFYEVIDQIGPQLGWWVWNYDVPSGLPRFGAVPYLNLQAFAIGIPLGIALLDARHGLTTGGLPTGVPAYSAVCAVAGGLAGALARPRRRWTAAGPDAADTAQAAPVRAPLTGPTRPDKMKNS